MSVLVTADGATCYSATVNDWVCWDYVEDRRSELIDATTQHIYITVIAVALGFVIALVLALIARRFGRAEGSILGLTTIIYTIPSLAMFSLLVDATGLTPTTIIVGLALYCLAILVRNILAGLRAVPDDVRESAIGLGYGRTRLLFKIELPLALPVIMAGLRVATVSTVALTTVGTIVSYGGLGNLLNDAIPLEFHAQILTASVLCVLLAIVFDLVLVAMQRMLTPWTRARA
ncbi:MAG: ABC transporter permease [Actinomycetia bacterium]|nr:ABC transporter permease [Actinomycetes bacterium]